MRINLSSAESLAGDRASQSDAETPGIWRLRAGTILRNPETDHGD